MAKKKPEVPKYGTIILKGIRGAAAGGGDHLSSAASNGGRVLRKVAVDAVGKGFCLYAQRLYEGHEKLYHQTFGRDVYGGSHF